MLPLNNLLILAAEAPSAGNLPLLAYFFIAILSGGMILALVAVYKARPERDLTVASTAEKQVAASLHMLADETKRADRAEKRNAELEAALETMQVELEALRAQVEDLTDRLGNLLRESRDRIPDEDAK